MEYYRNVRPSIIGHKLFYLTPVTTVILLGSIGIENVGVFGEILCFTREQFLLLKVIRRHITADTIYILLWNFIDSPTI